MLIRIVLVLVSTNVELKVYPDATFLSLSPFQVEAVLAGSSYVDNVMLHADPFNSNCVAIVVPSQHALEEWAAKAGIQYSSFKELCPKPEAVKEVLSSINKVLTLLDTLFATAVDGNLVFACTLTLTYLPLLSFAKVCTFRRVVAWNWHLILRS